MVKKTSNFSTKIEPDLIKHIAKELETTFIKTIHAQFNKILSSDSEGDNSSFYSKIWDQNKYKLKDNIPFVKRW